MILCAERFDRDPTGRSALIPTGTLRTCSCEGPELLPAGALPARQDNPRVSIPLILLTRRYGRRTTRRTGTTTS
jgi:hypothetical protein